MAEADHCGITAESRPPIKHVYYRKRGASRHFTSRPVETPAEFGLALPDAPQPVQEPKPAESTPSIAPSRKRKLRWPVQEASACPSPSSSPAPVKRRRSWFPADAPLALRREWFSPPPLPPVVHLQGNGAYHCGLLLRKMNEEETLEAAKVRLKDMQFELAANIFLGATAERDPSTWTRERIKLAIGRSC